MFSFVFLDFFLSFLFFLFFFSFVFLFFLFDNMTKKGSSAASSPSAALDNGGIAAGRFICSMCAKVYRSGAGLRYHKRKRHRGRLVLSEKEFLN